MKREFLIALINLITLNKHQASTTQYSNSSVSRSLGIGHYLGQLEIRSIRSILSQSEVVG